MEAMNVEELAPEALRLPPRERAMLAASLWESLEDPYGMTADTTDDEALALARLRDAEMESGAVSPVSHEELMRRLRR